MKVILTSDHPELALRFRDYIRQRYQRDLPLYQQQTHYFFALPQDDPQLTALLAEAEVYRRDPFAEKYTQASWQDGQTYSLKGRFNGFLPNPAQWKTALRRAPLTGLIGLICLLVYLLSLSDYQTSIYLTAHFPEGSAQYTQIWRFFTHALVHLSLPHLLFNLTYWLVFAAMIEKYCGTFKVLQLFLTVALISGVVQNFFSGAAFFGLSGVVYGVLGYVYVMSRGDSHRRFRLPSGFIYMLLVGIASGFIGPLFDVHFGNAAHISGLVLGAAIAWFDSKKSR
ncbi:GlpG protein [Pasteurella testudinis DSM 23072]|uniref:GlpG protein n=1 Tax=Pasteurella testudinis DSM 23072 TaxID=1122938 RepID=A0A1W1V3R9_9PAST|nr:rhomboid family intramembrane serine protease [Pasteurella testudinis]SMB87691.1 GlpG protein [Pasteurella testudinis DSM 23072]SUB50462.1 rhomboid protease GlpG [Pasteurella testudinis]